MWSGQISIIPKPELRGFWGSSLIKPPFRVTSSDVVIICPDEDAYSSLATEKVDIRFLEATKYILSIWISIEDVFFLGPSHI